MKYLFVLNPKSFWHRWKLEQVLASIHEFCKNAGSDDYVIHVSRFPRDSVGFIKYTAAALPEGTTLRVFAVGGDGILFDCLNGIMGLPNAELGALPYGHTNSFIRGFGKKNKTVFRKIDRQISAAAVPMDVIRSGSNYVLNYCAIGVDAVAIRNALAIHGSLEAGGSFSQWLGRRFYDKFYYMGAVPACLNTGLLHQRYEVAVDGEDFSGQYRGILVANGSFYWGNKCPAVSAMPTDGLLDIIFARSAGRLRSMSLVPLYAAGRYNRFPNDFVMKRARKIRIRAVDTFLVNCDDIAFYDSECTIEVLHGAIRFVNVSKQGYGEP
jgi:diacylglycerol kinase family enzyme